MSKLSHIPIAAVQVSPIKSQFAIDLAVASASTFPDKKKGLELSIHESMCLEYLWRICVSYNASNGTRIHNRWFQLYQYENHLYIVLHNTVINETVYVILS